MKHKHAEVIKAWADGAEIEFWNNYYEVWDECKEPAWSPNLKYRIKPKEKVVRWLWVWVCESPALSEWYQSPRFLSEDEAEEFFGKNLKIRYRKLNWSRQEFDE